MAFITAGMGGGTGTGGAPILAKICKDLGILTVGIVTTPFAYEGRKRQLQAEEGIKVLKQYVDTLLVISNDKLRHQFGNLKMREAFEKADNVLATAAKCITDVINSTGQINVDFADVCTVMRNGGVAILGSAAVSGEGRAHRAIEEALNSPLLNDNDIRGAKWILININSCEGQHEFTMDEVEVIQNYLLSQAGENTDVILGLGYDNSLGDKLGITLIATGFEHKDPFTPKQPKKEEKKEEKIVMILGQTEQPKKEVKEIPVQPEPQSEKVVLAVAPKKEEQVKADPLAPRLVEDYMMEVPMPEVEDIVEIEALKEDAPIYLELEPLGPARTSIGNLRSESTNELSGKNTVGKNLIPEKKDDILLSSSTKSLSPTVKTLESTTKENSAQQQSSKKDTSKDNSASVSAASGGYLARPSNIYAESKGEVYTSMPSAEDPVPLNEAAREEEELLDLQMQLVERDDIPAADKPLAHHSQAPLSTEVEDPAMLDETEEQKRRAAERLHKLRNLSFNVNAADPNNEFETVPAYIRRNMELYNSNSHIENFYSSYEVKTDKNNQAHISTINTFLDGQKPD
jgi:cell division protein FtsZ